MFNKNFLKNEKGSLTVEIALIIAIFVLGVVAALLSMGKDIQGGLDKTSDLVSLDRHDFEADIVPPTGNISTVGNFDTTNQSQIQLSLAADDGKWGSGIGAMRFSEDGTTWYEWETFTPLKSWTLTGEDGEKEIFVQYRDGVGNESLVYSYSVLFDTTAPAGTMKINNDKTYCNSTSVILNNAGTDTINTMSKMRFSANGSTWTAWETYASTRNFTLNAGDGTKTVYAQYQDKAGNISEIEIKDSIILDMTAPVIITPLTANKYKVTVASMVQGNWQRTQAFRALMNPVEVSDTHSIIKWEYSINGSGWTNYWDVTGNTTPTRTSNYALTPAYNNSVSVRATDAAGNTTISSTTIFLGEIVSVVVRKNVEGGYSSTLWEKGDNAAIPPPPLSVGGYEISYWKSSTGAIQNTGWLSIPNIQSSQDWVAYYTFTGASSCPFLYVWNGREYAFEADLYPVSRLGALAGTTYTKPNPADYYVVENEMKTKDGYFEAQFTNESPEADYTDEMVMYAVDVPIGTKLESIQPARGGSFIPITSAVKTVSKETTPVKATIISTGENVSAKIAKSNDGKYAIINPDKENSILDYIELDLGDLSAAKEIKLIVDAASWTPMTPEGREKWFEIPAKSRSVSVEVLNGAGEWTAIKTNLDKPGEFQRTYLADLTGKFLTNNYKVRIRYSTAVYIDSISVDTSKSQAYTVQKLELAEAELYHHGVNGASTNGYLVDFTWWNHGGPINKYLGGYYTKFGNVTPLLTSTDDKFVVMGDGDAIKLKWKPVSTAPAAGMTRYYVVYTNGYYKYLITGLAPFVDPLPFKNMSNYPYSESEYYPTDAEHQSYLKEWNTRYHENTTGK